ncbi:MAG: uroporphyrinogen decarboxylase family protein [Victivallaceae bacterium]
MNDRQRTLEALLFGKPDRIPFIPGSGRESTRARWHREGLPKYVRPEQITEYAYREAGGKLDFPSPGMAFSVDERMMPHFEEKVIEKKADSQIVQDWKGNICEIGNEFSVEYLRNAIDFVTRRWIKCPVESWDDWENMRARYNADDAARYPTDRKELKNKLTGRDNFLGFHFSGPYWQLREWCGFEGLSMMFYDNPELVKAMLDFWRDYIIRLMENAFEYCIPDMVHISEDMAYKGYSMLSPSMTREFLLPVWEAWGKVIKKAGIPVYACDSDGFIAELIPIWIEAGINICDPIEVAAGNDINEFRRRFGKKMAYRGGVDKREMAKGGKFIEAEIKRLEPVIKSGGFIPSCDHGVPADVSWPDFVYYSKLLAEAVGWM